MTFAVTRRVTVARRAAPVDHLNELEVVDGLVFANVWLTDRIAIIDARRRARGGLAGSGGPGARRASSGNAVLNGIAYDSRRRSGCSSPASCGRRSSRFARTDRHDDRSLTGTRCSVARQTSVPRACATSASAPRQDQPRPARAGHAARRVPRAAHRLPGRGLARHRRVRRTRGPVRHRVRRRRRAPRPHQPGRGARPRRCGDRSRRTGPPTRRDGAVDQAHPAAGRAGRRQLRRGRHAARPGAAVEAAGAAVRS